MAEYNDNTGDDAFDALVRRMHEPIEDVQITEIAETASLVEILVPIKHFPHPEHTLMSTLAAYVTSGPRRAIIAMNVVYELREDNPVLIASVLFTAEPV